MPTKPISMTVYTHQWPSYPLHQQRVVCRLQVECKTDRKVNKLRRMTFKVGNESSVYALVLGFREQLGGCGSRSGTEVQTRVKFLRLSCTHYS